MSAGKMRTLKILCRNRFLRSLVFLSVCVLIIQFWLKYRVPSSSEDYLELNIKEANKLTEDKIYVKDYDGAKEADAALKQKLKADKNQNDDIHFNDAQHQLNKEDEKKVVQQGKPDREKKKQYVLTVDKEQMGDEIIKKDDTIIHMEKGDNVDKEKGDNLIPKEKGDSIDNEKGDNPILKEKVDNHVDKEKGDNLIDKEKEANLIEIEKGDDNKSVGYHGEAVVINESQLSPEELEKYKNGWKTFAFNNYVSDMISVDRPLFDVRDKRCLLNEYPKDLPNTSVVICFHNEAWSVLIRTVHSVINKSPRQLIHEIILVDDASKFDHLKKPLEEHVATLPVPVKIVRTEMREGLIRGRLLGYKVATGETLTFLDSHCECTDGWLEPLMARIAADRKTVVCPVIPVIDKDTFQVNIVRVEDISIGVFDWKLIFTWSVISPEIKAKRSSPVSPVPSPTMAGGLFSINRDYFGHLGTYDEEMDIWGGENLELSFRIWMCGGTLEQLPCSLVGHVFRDRSPYSSPPGSFLKNTLRVAMVWMDEYKDIFLKTLTHIPEYGDISKRVALRKRLNCKSFDWYMKNVYPNAFYPSKATMSGKLYNHANSNMCMDSMGDYTYKKKKVQWRPCKNSTNQIWYYMSNVPEIRQLTTCLDTGESGKFQSIGLFPCHEMQGNQEVSFTEEGAIYFKAKNKCLEAFTANLTIALRDCNGGKSQKWSWRT